MLQRGHHAAALCAVAGADILFSPSFPVSAHTPPPPAGPVVHERISGARGLLALRRAGAATLAQDQATSVVYGMPGAAARLGAAGQVLPLPSIAAAVLRHCGGTARAAASG
ncbi:MAG TPA: chemotaxis protein CheB [Longimicrobium sp.]